MRTLWCGAIAVTCCQKDERRRKGFSKRIKAILSFFNGRQKLRSDRFLSYDK